MAPKKREEETIWISAPETLKVLEEVNQRPIHPKYLHILAKNNRIARKPIDRRTYLYSKQDAEKTKIIERKGAGRRAVPKTEPDLRAVRKPQTEAA